MKSISTLVFGVAVLIVMANAPVAEACGSDHFVAAATPHVYTRCTQGKLVLGDIVNFTSRGKREYPVYVSQMGWNIRLDGDKIVIQENRSNRIYDVGTIDGAPNDELCKTPDIDPQHPNHWQVWDLKVNGDTRLFYSIKQDGCRYVSGGGWMGGAPGWYKPTHVRFLVETAKARLKSPSFDWSTQLSTKLECEQFQP